MSLGFWDSQHKLFWVANAHFPCLILVHNVGLQKKTNRGWAFATKTCGGLKQMTDGNWGGSYNFP